MGNKQRFLLAEAELQAAFGLDGCPICRIRKEAERRYLFHLLWENVNDLSTRERLVRSYGFCPSHTWALFQLEQEAFGDHLGSAILYQDLVARLSAHLGRRNPEGRRAARRVAGHRRHPYIPESPCPACEQGEATEQRAVGWLVAACADEGFREAYRASEGLCYRHLLQALELASRTTEDKVAHFLAAEAAARLETLSGDLEGYIRKHVWQYRNEPMEDRESRAPARAARFFGGFQGEATGDEPERDEGSAE